MYETDLVRVVYDGDHNLTISLPVSISVINVWKMSPCPDIGSQCHNDWSEPRQSVISQVVMKAISVQYSPGVILTKFDVVLKVHDKRREEGRLLVTATWRVFVAQ